MAKALVVVESPAKAKTINKYLGANYTVIASMGHIRDLPKSKLGVDVDNDFEESYESIGTRKKVIKELKDAAKDATEIYVATDPDREGEAIGWHLIQELGGKKKKIYRLTFNEITKKAVQDALLHPRNIDEKMVAAQRARRVLDRLVGYKISPLLWDKVRRGLSAGRVQSVALKLVCDREREIEKFVPEEYWHVFAELAGPQPPEFEAKLLKKDDEAIRVGNEEQSSAVVAALEGASWIVSSVTTKERRRNAPPPFITSKLQQTARFPVKKTMMLAQQLYEGVDLSGLGADGTVGLITYMRTDSVRVSDDAVTAVREHIGKTFGPDYLPEKANAFKTKSDAQDAHEAIRPTSMQFDPDTVRSYLTQDQYSLYRLIWNRFVASQMTPSTFDETTVDIKAAAYVFRVKGTVPKFAGWMATYDQTAEQPDAPEAASKTDKGEDEEASAGVLPPLAEGDRLTLKRLRPEQKFTQPPPRFTEATLVKELEENGIGRPSTYASIIGVLQDRDYVNKTEGKFKPTTMGLMITDLLTKSFDDIIDVEYTRGLEEDLDKIEQGKTDYVKTLTEFYKKFKKDLARAGKEMQNLKEGVKTDEICDRCQSPMLIKVGRFGPFIACSAYPECTNTRELEKNEPESETGEEEIEPCENCGKPMVVKRGRFGQFLACTGYPECKTTRKLIATKQGGLKAAKPDQILDEKCPRCSSNLVIKQGRFGEFTACTKYPECKYVKHKTTGLKCPKDADKGGEVVERKSKRGKVFFGCSNYPDCDFVLWNRPVLEPCPSCGAPFLVEKITKKHGRQLLCNNEECDYVRSEELVETPPSATTITIVGGGLAGTEAAWQAASLGVPVTLFEMRPARPTAVHKTDRLAELVCSNSFRGDKLDNAVGLLKEEMRRLGSLVMRAAEASRVPAGAALAVDRERFADLVTSTLGGHPMITIVRDEVVSIPDSSPSSPVIVATGPLTSAALSADIARLVGGEHLYFYDAISPIVLAESIDRGKVFRQSRWNRSLGPAAATPPSGPACGIDDGAGDYLNCPFTRDEYERFYDALVHAESATVHDFDKERFFEGCLPIEVMAHRGVDTLRFGPMKPVGLVDPRTGREPYAAVQLRQDNLAGDHFSLVGFQTQIKWGEQARVLRLVPGLEQAEFVRYGMVHRNTYVNGPTVLAETWQVRQRPSLFFAGQMSGVEGYVESAASGLLAGLNAAAMARGEATSAPPRTTAIGALSYYVSHADPAHYEPSNITFGIMEPLARPPKSKMARKTALANRALAALDDWRSHSPVGAMGRTAP